MYICIALFFVIKVKIRITLNGYKNGKEKNIQKNIYFCNAV